VEESFKRIIRVPSSRQLSRANFCGKRVLARFDFNIPIEDGEIEDEKRIDVGIPTIKKILERGASEINIICHLGRPKNASDDSCSTKIIAQYLSKKLSATSLPKIYRTDIDSPALSKFYQITDKVRLFENIRYDEREEKNSVTFAKQLSRLGDVFVLDAFANIHRQHSSMDAIQNLLPTYTGLVMEREINVLHKILYAPERPFVAIIGGAKVEDKLPIIKALGKKSNAVIVGGKTANEWVARGMPSGKNIFLPSDGINKMGSIVSMDEENIKKGIFDIGPQTIMLYKSVLASAKTVFWNGNLGMTEDKKFIHGTYEIARYIKKLKCEKVASGGNTSEVIEEMGIESSFDFISTGGGATSDLIAGKSLPVLNKLLK
jgi:phosphoglycerate kinase